MPPHVRSRIFLFFGVGENKSRESGEFVRANTIVCCGASIVAHFASKVSYSASPQASAAYPPIAPQNVQTVKNRGKLLPNGKNVNFCIARL